MKLLVIAPAGYADTQPMHAVADFRLWLASKMTREADKNMSGDRSSSQYLSPWERLPDALKRITDAGVAETTAKQNICNAIADRAVKFRCEPRKHASHGRTAHGKVIDGSDVDIPARLGPQDIDFENSRPLKDWLIARERIPSLAGYWSFEWVQLLRADVTEYLIPRPESDHLCATNRGQTRRKLTRRRKSQPARDGAYRAISELCSNGVPDQVTEPNANLCKRVATKLKELNLPAVSDDTILRAAGRRK